MKAKKILSLWDEFWFSEQSPAPVCLFRILFGLLVLETAILWSPDLLTWFGPHGVLSMDTTRSFLNLPGFNIFNMPRFSFFFVLPNSDQTVIVLFCLIVVFALFVTIGLFTRVSLVAVFLLLLSFDHRNLLMMNGADTLLKLFALILVFSPAGAMFSLDYLIRKRQGKAPADPWQIRSSMWTERLLQLQVAAVYCQSFGFKIIGEHWQDGTAIYYVSKLEEVARFPVPFLFDHLWTCRLLTWGTLLVELALWTLVWFKGVRYYVLLAGVALHLGIDWALNLPVFEYVMIASFINFVDPSDLKRALDFLTSKLSGNMLSRQEFRQGSP